MHLNLCLNAKRAENRHRNRSVDPLSPTSSFAFAGRAPIGVINSPAVSCVSCAPSASRHCTVASISALKPSRTSRDGALESAAQMSIRCACDLEAGI